MKRLNRKGFTLIELLAVIVILAIVLVVTIPSVISSLNSAREKSLQNAADVVSDWMTKQYQQDKLGIDVDESYSSLMNTMLNTSFKYDYLNKFSTNYNRYAQYANSFFGDYTLVLANNASTYNLSEESLELLKAAGISNVENNICTEDNGNDDKCSTQSGAYPHYSGFQLQGERICVRLCAKEGGSFWTTDFDSSNSEAKHCKLSSGCTGDGVTGFNLKDKACSSSACAL